MAPEKLLGQCIFERVYPDDLPLIRSGFDRILAGERRILFPCFRYRQETGAFVHLEASGTNLLDEPSIAGIVFVVRDISERVRSERTTREWKHRYELLSRAAGQVVWDCDIEGRMVWGGCIQETLGYAPEEMLGDLPQWKGRISPEERDAVADKYGAALAAATDFGAEYCFLHKSGHRNGFVGSAWLQSAHAKASFPYGLAFRPGIGQRPCGVRRPIPHRQLAQ